MHEKEREQWGANQYGCCLVHVKCGSSLSTGPAAAENSPGEPSASLIPFDISLPPAPIIMTYSRAGERWSIDTLQWSDDNVVESIFVEQSCTFTGHTDVAPRHPQLHFLI